MPIPDKIAMAQNAYEKQLSILQDSIMAEKKEADFEKNMINILLNMIELKTEMDILNKVVMHQTQQADN